MPSRALLAAAAVLALPALAACGSEEKPAPPPARTQAPEPRTEPGRKQPPPVRSQGGPRLETVATGLEVPWEIAFLPDGRALITERPGRVRLLSRTGKLQADPVARVQVSAIGEGGLLGMAIDPKFRDNGFVYLYRTTDSGNEVARYRFAGGRLREEAVIARGIQAGAIHDGGRVRFGPDGRLYFSTGEAGDSALAQKPNGLNGKILRMGPKQYRAAGGRPEVFSTGHRNPQGFDWQPGTGRFVEDEHGPEGNDEINILRQGANYGWPEIQGSETRQGFVSPIAVYQQSIAPSGATFVRRPGSEWTGDYLIGALIGEQIRRVRVEDGHVTLNEALLQGKLGRVRTVVEGPDGALYALTSNTDGRGQPRPGDDRVVRIVPPAG